MIEVSAPNPEIVVSLTTIRSRVERLRRVIRSLQNQTLGPNVIQLNISDEPYLLDEGIPFTELPQPIKRMSARGEIDIRYVPNTGPYRKLLPTLATRWDKDCLIVTADDDVIYAPNWLEELYSAYLEHGCVIAHRSRAIIFENGKLRGYRGWAPLRRDRPPNYGDIVPEFHKLFTLPTGLGGVLYHPRFFKYPDLLPDLMALAPKQDDLAFKVATLISGIPAHTLFADRPFAGAGGGAAKTSLFSTNRRDNDDAVAKLFHFVESRGLFSWAPYVSKKADATADE